MRSQTHAGWTKAIDLLHLRASTSRRLSPTILLRRRSAISWRGRPDNFRDNYRNPTLQLLASFLNGRVDMPAERQDTSLSASRSKKRKADKDLQRYYAVRVGLRPGVYLTWLECQKQTAGQKGAQYKSFFSREEAQAFVEGKFIPNPAGEKPAPPRYYAVARGSFTGIFNDWDTASLAIAGTKGPKYKRFDTYTGALEFIRLWGNEDTIAGAEAGALNAGIKIEPRKPIISASTKVTEVKKETEEETKQEILDLPQIYTDGSSLDNGKSYAKSGVGVYFGPNDPRNVSERLEGNPQTNQRAELTAILRALEATSVTQDVQIWTDSKYSINCVTTYYKRWETNNWKTQGEDVKNQDLIKAIREHLSRRDAAGTITSINWCKGHSNNPGNEAADELAVAGARKPLPTKSRRKLK
ncbi:hypothetical protein CORC01_08569 [Colletotrichum orchidophilum]|uniref:ribonuclease H n=1 Tax=Colletotrichum orchidophilum TaxID=1209926 RepID=A0A1G4B4J0_9PEZI|nr:uncharacterized protein CORC01_08569 [Colletotrichum orchidophilum]OHE96192.1 hypothetical protein CORC01_08569 [Colletotrichum orchidophilum]